MICVNQSKSRAEVLCFVLTNSRALRCWKRGSISWLQNSSTGKIWVRAPRSYTRRWLCITGIFLQPGVRVSAQVGASHIGGARCWCGQWWQSRILVENQDGGKERRSQWFNAIHFDLKLLRCCDAHVLLTSMVSFIMATYIWLYHSFALNKDRNHGLLWMSSTSTKCIKLWKWKGKIGHRCCWGETEAVKEIIYICKEY